MPRTLKKGFWWWVGGWMGGWWCLNANLVIGFGPSLGLGLQLRAKPINYCTLLKIIFYCRNNSRKKWKINYEDVESCITISTQIMPWLCLQGQEIDRNWYTTVMKHRYENSFTHLLWPRYFSSSARSTSWTCTNSFHSVSFTSNQLFNTLIHFSIFHYSTLVFSGRPA